MPTFYDVVMSPIEQLFLNDIRIELGKYVKGDVLEIGVGSGINFKYFDFGNIISLTCLDLEVSSSIVKKYPNISFSLGSMENLPFKPQTFDCIISTLVLCSVDIEKSIEEIKRVLKPKGVYIFLEHVKPTGKVASKAVDKVNKIWNKLANGCNLNRETDKILQKSGFSHISIMEKNIFRYGIATL